ncbi:MAG: hypothetical protein ACXAB9_15750 [Candidatus Thorarchaeota archaeon]|jgi:hypothetical protein
MMPSKVRVSVGLTIQLAPYNTARVQLDIEEEVDAPLAELDSLYEDLRDALVEKVQDLQQTAFGEGLVR